MGHFGWEMKQRRQSLDVPCQDLTPLLHMTDVSRPRFRSQP
jgi:hypothetical protein